MIENIDVCKACEDLEDYAFHFVANGITDVMCQNLHNDKGLIRANNHTNCEDFHDMNDCLIGGMIDKLPTYDTCDMHEMMADILENLYNLLKGMICSDCGQWEQIHALWDEIDKIWAEINKLKDRVSALESQIGQLGPLSEALRKVLQNLYEAGAWNTTGHNIFNGSFNNGRHIANGNINLFGGVQDGNYFIRTNKGSTENDLYGGI